MRQLSIAVCRYAALIFSVMAYAQEPQFVYVPPTDFEQARLAIEAFPKQAAAPSFFVTKPGLSITSERTYVDWQWQDQGISLVVKRGPAIPLTFEYANLPSLGVVTDTILGVPFYGIRLSAEWWLWTEPRDPDRRLDWAKWLSNNFALRLGVLKGRQGFEQRFLETLTKYPTSENRPPLPEEARRFRLQGESAVEQRRLQDALASYDRAVQIAPWWAEGYFNLALLWAEQKQYDGAIRNMRRFVLLEPNHPKAREAQDQIYRWEDLQRTSK